MRKRITRKDKREKSSWGRRPSKIAIGTDENKFNEICVEQLNLDPYTSVRKMHGGKFQSGIPDIQGRMGLLHLNLENKFIQYLRKTRDSTVVLSKKEYRSSQIEFFREYQKTLTNLMRNPDQHFFEEENHEYDPRFLPVAGSLVGVYTGDHKLNFILGLEIDFILNNREIKHSLLTECLEMKIETETPFIRLHFFPSGGRIRKEIYSYSTLPLLVRSLQCH